METKIYDVRLTDQEVTFITAALLTVVADAPDRPDMYTQDVYEGTCALLDRMARLSLGDSFADALMAMVDGLGNS